MEKYHTLLSNLLSISEYQTTKWEKSYKHYEKRDVEYQVDEVKPITS